MSIAMDFVKNIKVGVSIGDTLDSHGKGVTSSDLPEKAETLWGNPVITKELIDSILASGFNLIRLPVTWSQHIIMGPEYKIQDAWMARIKEVVDYAYSQGAYVILNLHHESWNFPYYDNQDAACYIMKCVWGQICEVFADYDEHLIFEAQNEPRKIGTEVEWNGGDQEGWDVVNATNFAFLETVRAAKGYNPARFVMLPGYGANCKVGTHHIDLPEGDDRVIISVHAYEPYEFCLQIPGRDVWNHDTEVIDWLMNDLKTMYIDKEVPVIIGEFGAMNKNGNEDERTEWVKYYTNAAAAVSIPCVWWDNARFEGPGENFGLFNRYDYKVVYPKIVKALTEKQ